MSGGRGKNSMEKMIVLLTYFRFCQCPRSIGGITGRGDGIEKMTRWLILEEGVATMKESSCAYQWRTRWLSLM